MHSMHYTVLHRIRCLHPMHSVSLAVTILFGNSWFGGLCEFHGNLLRTNTRRSTRIWYSRTNLQFSLDYTNYVTMGSSVGQFDNNKMQYYLSSTYSFFYLDFIDFCNVMLLGCLFQPARQNDEIQ